MKEYISREDALNFTTSETFGPDRINAVMEGMAEYAKHIREVPAADVVEVVHGYWITRIRHEHYPSGKEYEEDYRSVCGKRGSREYDYCPHCGALMDACGR